VRPTLPWCPSIEASAAVVPASPSIRSQCNLLQCIPYACWPPRRGARQRRRSQRLAQYAQACKRKQQGRPQPMMAHQVGMSKRTLTRWASGNVPERQRRHGDRPRLSPSPTYVQQRWPRAVETPCISGVRCASRASRGPMHGSLLRGAFTPRAGGAPRRRGERPPRHRLDGDGPQPVVGSVGGLLGHGTDAGVCEPHALSHGPWARRVRRAGGLSTALEQWADGRAGDTLAVGEATDGWPGEAGLAETRVLSAT